MNKMEHGIVYFDMLSVIISDSPWVRMSDNENTGADELLSEGRKDGLMSEGDPK